jgi:hypothetical protein
VPAADCRDSNPWFSAIRRAVTSSLTGNYGESSRQSFAKAPRFTPIRKIVSNKKIVAAASKKSSEVYVFPSLVHFTVFNFSWFAATRKKIIFPVASIANRQSRPPRRAAWPRPLVVSSAQGTPGGESARIARRGPRHRGNPSRQCAALRPTGRKKISSPD